MRQFKLVAEAKFNHFEDVGGQFRGRVGVVEVGGHLRGEAGIPTDSGRADQSHPPGSLLPCALRHVMYESSQLIVESVGILILEIDGVEKLAVVIVPFNQFG